MLYIHHRSLVRQGMMNEDTLPEVEDIEIGEEDTVPVFVDKDGEPLMVTPWSIKKLVYMSSPQGGVEYVRSASKMENDGSMKRWRIGWLTLLAVMVVFS